MPNFRSIPLHPSVTSRLLQTEKNASASSGGSNNQNIDNDSQHRRRPQHPGQQLQQQESQTRNTQPLFASVDTPRALLTRDPHTLVDLFAQGQIRNDQQRALLLEQMEGIRHQISLEMCQQTRTGQNVLLQQHDQQDQNEPLIPGASMSALLMKNLQQQRVSFNKEPYTISTRCRALDELIAFPEEFEYSSGNQHQQQPWDQVAAEFDDEAGTDFRKGGLPRGYVLSLTGTTGKTQLCLQLAAQVCLQTSERVRYFYSTAGHAGPSLARRLKQLLDAQSEKSAKYQRLKQVEFVPIANSSQLLVALAELEEEWMQGQQDQTTSMDTEISSHDSTSAVSMLILDSWPLMLVDREENDSMRYLERWLKRMARQHAVWIVVTGVGPTSAAPLEAADIQLQLIPEKSSLTNLRLLRHPAKLVTNQDHISLLNTNGFGMTTQE